MIIRKQNTKSNRSLVADSFSKATQLFKVFGVHRNPESLRKLLNVRMPSTVQESQAERFGKCALPRCFSYGTVDHPLDLHHVVPRSQSKSRIDDFTNHLYLCGDFFPNNHHKAIHGLATPGKKHWEELGIFGKDFSEAIPCEEIMATEAQFSALLAFAAKDSMARILLRSNVSAAISYAITRGVVESFSVLSEDNKKTLSLWREKDVPWTSLQRLKIR